MVQLTQGLLDDAGTHRVVQGAGEEHQEHARDEEDDTEGHLPPLTGSGPDEPDATEGKDDSGQVGPRIAVFKTYFFHDWFLLVSVFFLYIPFFTSVILGLSPGGIAHYLV